MASHMEPAKLETFLVHILTPVQRLTEDDTVRDTQMGKRNPLSKLLLINGIFFFSGTEDDGS